MYFEKFVTTKSHSDWLSGEVGEERRVEEGRGGKKYKTNADNTKNRIESGNMPGGG